MSLVDANGRAVVLGRELGRGGEGAVYDIPARPGSVAKVYDPPKPGLGPKLAAMVPLGDAGLLALAAWPTGTLHGRAGGVAGFIMPKVDGHRPVFQLYGPKLRLREFPSADWRFLIHAAANTARAFAAVHERGFVIGDVNHGNLVVGMDARVRLLDCDSFQVASGGQRWLCEVGTGTHQPPEMQGLESYKSVVRTANHDNFGLAVLVFQLLCMARHPFAGRHLGPGEAPTIEEAIARSRYAFSADQRRTRMAPPPGTLPMAALTPTIRALFEAAFAPESAGGGRPGGPRWAAALQELSADLRRCTVNHAHHYLADLAHCPWCAIEAASGTRLFAAVFVADAGSALGMAALWQEVSAMVPPELPLLPDPLATPVQPSAEVLAWKRQRLRRQVWILLACAVPALVMAAMVPARFRLLPVLLAAGLALVLSFARGSLREAVRKELAAATEAWEQLRAACLAPAARPGFDEVRRSLAAVHAKHDGLGRERSAKMTTQWERRRQAQLAEHLDRYDVATAKLPGIGRARVATLQAHGIDTALDIDAAAVVRVPGFGPATVKKLIDWRRACEQDFVFDAARGVAEVDHAGVERTVAGAARALEAEMASGLAQLRAITHTAALRRRMLEGQAAEMAPRLAQAAANARALGVSVR